VGLTDAGNEIYSTINQLFMERVDKLMGQLSPEERQTFTSLLLKVLDGLEAQA
jgi:hypothetical protein